MPARNSTRVTCAIARTRVDLLGLGQTSPSGFLWAPTGLERRTPAEYAPPLCYARPSHINATSGTCVAVSAKSAVSWLYRTLRSPLVAVWGAATQVAACLHKRFLSHRWALQVDPAQGRTTSTAQWAVRRPL